MVFWCVIFGSRFADGDRHEKPGLKSDRCLAYRTVLDRGNEIENISAAPTSTRSRTRLRMAGPDAARAFVECRDEAFFAPVRTVRRERTFAAEDVRSSVPQLPSVPPDTHR